MKRLILFLLVVLSVAIYLKTDLLGKRPTKYSPENVSTSASPSKKGASGDDAHVDIKIIAENLNIPWDLAFINEREFLVTERSGNLLKISAVSEKTTVKKIAEVTHTGEGGLLGLALDPEFENNKYLYLYYTYTDRGSLFNKVERYKFENDNLTDATLILGGIIGSKNHDGGRIRFGPDGLLYITTGDAENTATSQNLNSLNGKILRINSDGTIPESNASKSAVYSFGHRNPQGLTWDDNGNLWSSEHGPSGLQTGNDEINLIESGKNYGWPVIKGKQTSKDMQTPNAESGKGTAWAPGDILFYKGALYVPGLRGSSIYKAPLDENKITKVTPYFKGEFGRIRTIVLGPDGYFYITTSNKDGRGLAKKNDDKIIRINPKVFE